MTKTLSLRVNEQTYALLRRRAQAQNRSISNFIETAVKEHIEESNFLDDVEMAEILANDELAKRLKKGSLAARKKIGRWVE